MPKIISSHRTIMGFAAYVGIIALIFYVAWPYQFTYCQSRGSYFPCFSGHTASVR